MIAPYRSTAAFDETTLPAALRREHSTKAGVWGVIRVIEGRLRLQIKGSREHRVLTPDQPGLVMPEQVHCVEPMGRMRLRVDFYDRPPDLGPGG